ncbi:MAG: hypothetical protein AABY53_06115 [Bdellovibrionota bacterium]
MTKPRHFYTHPKVVRDSLLRATEASDQIQELEKKLVLLLYEIDQKRFYVRFGYKSLKGFCIQGLKFSETQSQRIVTNVRRYISKTENIHNEIDIMKNNDIDIIKNNEIGLTKHSEIDTPNQHPTSGQKVF